MNSWSVRDEAVSLKIFQAERQCLTPPSARAALFHRNFLRSLRGRQRWSPISTDVDLSPTGALLQIHIPELIKNEV